MNEYVTKHNFGSWESDKSVRKLLIRDIDDMRTYLDTMLPDMFEDGSNSDCVIVGDSRHNIELSVINE